MELLVPVVPAVRSHVVFLFLFFVDGTYKSWMNGFIACSSLAAFMQLRAGHNLPFRTNIGEHIGEH